VRAFALGERWMHDAYIARPVVPPPSVEIASSRAHVQGQPRLQQRLGRHLAKAPRPRLAQQPAVLGVDMGLSHDDDQAAGAAGLPLAMRAAGCDLD